MTSPVNNNMNTPPPAANTPDPQSPAAQESQFLTMFMTELQSQDPTDPVSTTDYMTQMAQFSMIEQQINTNTTLSSISTALGGNTGTLLGYLGTNVEVATDDNEAPIQNGQVSWSYTLPSDATNVTLTVTDANGDVVSTSDGNTAAGTYKYSLSDSSSSDEGQTLFLTVTATDAAGNAVDPVVYGYATVDGINNISGSSMLEAGNMSFSSADVVWVAAATPSTNNSSSNDGSSDNSGTDDSGADNNSNT